MSSLSVSLVKNVCARHAKRGVLEIWGHVSGGRVVLTFLLSSLSS
jgi:hypothetical protein